MSDPYTIRIFVPDGDPEGVRIVDRMNWTGKGIAFPRSKWGDLRQRMEFGKAGVYILVGYREGSSDDLPTVYVGKATREMSSRIESHYKNKDFWETGVVFVSTGAELNAGHVEWLEFALVDHATRAKRSHLDNGNVPQEPALSESDKADTRAFLKEILQILPLLGIHSFEKPKAISTTPIVAVPGEKKLAHDTIVVPAQEDGFKKVFLGEDCWYAIRISGGMLPNIRYIAAYQTAPVGAVTYVAEVDHIEPYGDEGKYKVVFKGKAQPIGPIPFADAPQGMMQGPRYTDYVKLVGAKKLMDIFA
jgi:hypothetical protein